MIVKLSAAKAVIATASPMLSRIVRPPIFHSAWATRATTAAFRPSSTGPAHSDRP